VVSLNDVLEPEERLHAPQVQLSDDFVDGEDREVTPEASPSSRMMSPRALTSLGGPRSQARQASSSLGRPKIIL